MSRQHDFSNAHVPRRAPQALYTIPGENGTVWGTVLSTAAVPQDRGQPCWYCNSTESPADIYKPCNCPTVIHRACFRKWRQGWINPRNYFSCPECMYNYQIERIKPSTTDSKARIERQCRFALAKLWLGILVFVAALVCFWTLVIWAGDRENKSVPVGVKYMLSSVVSGFPDANSTSAWRESFKKPETPTWPYYTVLGALISSVVILLIFCFGFGCTFDETERGHRVKSCNDPCTSCCGPSNSNGLMYCYCYEPCPQGVGNQCCYICGKCGNSDGSGCSSGGSNCDCDNCDVKELGENGAQAAIILVIVAAIIIIFSAIFIIVIFAVQKSAILLDKFSRMIRSQQEDLEGETIVLGMDEVWRPMNEV